MKAIRRRCAVPLLAAALTIPRIAWAGPGEGSYQSRASGDWLNPATWEIHDAAAGGWRVATVEDGVPNIDDRAAIQSGHVVAVSGRVEIGKLVIERGNGFPQEGVREGIRAPAVRAPAARGTGTADGGVLEVTAGGILTIGEGLKMPQRPQEAAAGRIVFSGAGRAPGTILARTSIGIGGDVEVIGAAGGVFETRHPDHTVGVGRFAQISATGGPLTFDTALSMDGRVIADGPHAVRVTGLEVREGSSGKWVIAHPKARVSFETANRVHLRAGEIDVREGTLETAVDFEAERVTRGAAGRIEVCEGKSFSARQLTEEKADQADAADQANGREVVR
ncbi:MAG: hypothetical protein HOP29_14860 [Phycisphaerales bacterium]|nr:hypothetical protein [Phycisphaerales bacterium]